MIPDRVLACMLDTERELFKLGIPVKTRHNEVAPGQYEIAPLYENANIATDHQQIIMLMLKKVAQKYGMECLLHEKPFAGINGSGKHLNWSIGNSTQGNLLEPGETPHDNMQFLLVCGAVIRAVHKYAHLLRAVVATANNDHRLGANEAPPAIISIFLGDQLADVFEQIKGAAERKTSKAKGTLTVGVDTLPVLPKDAGDRNRTSPFALYGQQVRVHALWAAANRCLALWWQPTRLLPNHSTSSPTRSWKKATSGDLGKVPAAAQKILQDIITKHGGVIFNGDGYSAAWHEEAEKRGLPNLKSCVDALPVLAAPEVAELLNKSGVLTPRELQSRHDIYLEQYIKTVGTEAKLVVEMSRTMIFPAAVRYQNELAMTCTNLEAAWLHVRYRYARRRSPSW